MKTIGQIFSTILILLVSHIGYGQQKTEGIVLDSDNRQRLAKVFIVNVSSGVNVFNNSKGEFTIDVKRGDILIASKDKFKNDTLVYEDQPALVFKLKPSAIFIEEVTVVASKTPEQILLQRQIDYNKAYRLADGGDYLSVGDNGAGLSINAIYNLFSKEAKNARRLTNFFQREYEDNVIDVKFSKALVRSVTKLEGELLDNYLLRYRPTYDFARRASNYQMTKYILTKLEHFKIFPDYKPLPNLKKVNLDEK